jgi:hypothetical protein
MIDKLPGEAEEKEEGKGSWATEGIPLAVRKEMLERDLKKLGERAGASAQPGGSVLQEMPADNAGASGQPADPSAGGHAS